MTYQKDYLTPNEVAELLRVAPVTVRSWAAKGLLRAELTPGGHRRFLRKDVEEFVRCKVPQQYMSALRILIVDDDRFITDYLCAILEDTGVAASLATAHDGFEAGLKIATFAPNVVLLDLMMPGLDGFEVCRRIKGDPATHQIRVLAMSGSDHEEDRLRIIEAGAERFFRKPVGEQDLLQTLGIQAAANT